MNRVIRACDRPGQPLSPASLLTLSPAYLLTLGVCTGTAVTNFLQQLHQQHAPAPAQGVGEAGGAGSGGSGGAGGTGAGEGGGMARLFSQLHQHAAPLVSAPLYPPLSTRLCPPLCARPLLHRLLTVPCLRVRAHTDKLIGTQVEIDMHAHVLLT